MPSHPFRQSLFAIGADLLLASLAVVRPAARAQARFVQPPDEDPKVRFDFFSMIRPGWARPCTGSVRS